jgi:lysozyme
MTVEKRPGKMAISKTKLSAAVLGLVLAGAPASVILDQFLNEKEGNSLTAYKDGSGIWTICRGATRVDGKPGAGDETDTGQM